MHGSLNPPGIGHFLKAPFPRGFSFACDARRDTSKAPKELPLVTGMSYTDLLTAALCSGCNKREGTHV